MEWSEKSGQGGTRGAAGGSQRRTPLGGGELEAWEGQVQESEEVSVVAHKFVVLRHRG